MLKNMKSDNWFKRNWFRDWHEKQDKKIRNEFTQYGVKEYGLEFIDLVVGKDGKPSALDVMASFDEEMGKIQKRRDGVLDRYLNGEITQKNFETTLKEIQKEEDLFIRLTGGK